jgi:sRNA-binding regulator protein Hfq
VRVRLRNSEEVQGVVEYYDANFIRLTRSGEANLFIYKSDIKYLEEQA